MIPLEKEVSTGFNLWSFSYEKGVSARAVFLHVSSTSPEGTGVKGYKETAWQLLEVQRASW